MIKVRENTYNDEAMLLLLKKKATEWETALNDKCIYPEKIYVWIKEFSKQYYFKIEIDACEQEIQYEMQMKTDSSNLPTLIIKETHYKTFYKDGNKWIRQDVSKNEIAPTLFAVDTLVKQYEEMLLNMNANK